jgi:hypothetical protein
MWVDITFAKKIPFLVSVDKPLHLLLSTLIRTRSTTDIDQQIAILHSEGFRIVEITSDGEGAVGSLKKQLDSLGCKSIHSKSTHSADVDVKIKQLKGAVRSCSLSYSSPFLLRSASPRST